MKKLLLPVYKKNEPRASHPYYILFNVGSRLEFKSKRKAEDYARKISAYMTDSIRILNTVQKELYSLYVESYFKLHPYHANKARRMIESYLERLDYFHTQYSKGNECIKFISYYSLLNNVEDGCNLMKKAVKDINDYNSVNRLNAYLQMISNIYKEMDKLKKGNIDTAYRQNKLKVIHKNRVSVPMT